MAAEDNEIAVLLRDQLDRQGMTYDQLRTRLTAQGMSQVPSAATLSKRFAGEGLRNSGSLVRAVISLCAPPDEAGRLQDEVNELLARARARDAGASAEPPDEVTPTTGGQPDLTAEVRDLRLELERERARRHRSEVTAALLFGLLAGHGQRQQYAEAVPPAAEVRSPEPAAVRAPEPSPGLHGEEELDRVVRWFGQQDPGSARIISAVRAAIDEALDGPGTGRYSMAQLDKAERAFLGHRVKVAVRRAFSLAEGEAADATVDGVQFDVRFSLRRNGWILPNDRVGTIVLLIYGDEERGVCGAGLCRVTPAVLGPLNRDRKSRLRLRAGNESVVWLARDAPFPTNILLRLGPDAVRAIFARPTGQQRVEELLRRACGDTVEADAIATVAMQRDPLKRLRDARRTLAALGLSVLSWQNDADRERARELGLPELTGHRYAVVQDG